MNVLIKISPQLSYMQDTIYNLPLNLPGVLKLAIDQLQNWFSIPIIIR